MLTGDTRATADAVAKRLGISEVIADVLPNQKAGAIKRLQKEGRVAAMAGDGINDAPARPRSIGSRNRYGNRHRRCDGKCWGYAGKRRPARHRAGPHHQPPDAGEHQADLFFAFIYNSLGIPLAAGAPYNASMPKLWNDTIDAHRREVREAILSTTAALVGERGLQSVTMSQIAEQTGIGRATLYKYFSDVESILVAWNERHVAAHLEQLVEVRDRAGDAAERLEAVLFAFASVSHERHGTDLAALLHRGDHVARAQEHLGTMIRDLIAAAAKAGAVRNDVAPGELASYCLHALTAASGMRSKAAVRRLVQVTMAGLRTSE